MENLSFEDINTEKRAKYLAKKFTEDIINIMAMNSQKIKKEEIEYIYNSMYYAYSEKVGK